MQMLIPVRLNKVEDISTAHKDVAFGVSDLLGYGAVTMGDRRSTFRGIVAVFLQGSKRSSLCDISDFRRGEFDTLALVEC
jgi:hypothetical protein